MFNTDSYKLLTDVYPKDLNKSIGTRKNGRFTATHFTQLIMLEDKNKLQLLSYSLVENSLMVLIIFSVLLYGLNS